MHPEQHKSPVSITLKMSSKADLARIGKEGFDIIEAYHVKKTRPNPPKPYVSQEPKPTYLYPYQPQQARVYQVKQNEVMNCYEVLQFTEGVMIKDYRRKFQAMAY